MLTGPGPDDDLMYGAWCRAGTCKIHMVSPVGVGQVEKTDPIYMMESYFPSDLMIVRTGVPRRFYLVERERATDAVTINCFN